MKATRSQTPHGHAGPGSAGRETQAVARLALSGGRTQPRRDRAAQSLALLRLVLGRPRPASLRRKGRAARKLCQCQWTALGPACLSGLPEDPLLHFTPFLPAAPQRPRSRSRRRAVSTAQPSGAGVHFGSPRFFFPKGEAVDLKRHFKGSSILI